MNDVKLSPPYVEGYNMLKAFFDGDPEIVIGDLDTEARKCTVSSEVYAKYAALDKFLKDVIKEGSFGLNVEVIYTGNDKMTEQDLAIILGTNPHFKEITQIFEPIPMNSVIFKKEVIQYHNDNFFSPFGHKTTLAEDLVKQLFVNKPNCCTDVRD